MINIDLIGGARPNFVKLAPIVRAINKIQRTGVDFNYRFIHTGQHYSKALSSDFLEQLGIPEPEINLGAGSGTQAVQTAKIMIGYEQVLQLKSTDLCLVVGDVTSTMACSIVAKKMGVPVAHVEGGIRSGDWSMPEEINRVITDAISNWFFTTSETANKNLIRSGVAEQNIYFVGNTMVDTLLFQEDNLIKPKIWKSLGLIEKKYILLTLHRPSNVDETSHLIQTLSLIDQQCREHSIVFPVHPRTLKALELTESKFQNIHLLPPLSYLEFNYLVKNAMGVMTDSGGITEETTMFGIPCLTLRENTERPETVDIGTNEIVGLKPNNIIKAMDTLLDGQWKTGSIPDKWDGRAGERIVETLYALLSKNQAP